MFTFTPHFMLGFSLTLSNCAIHAFVFLYFLFPAPLSCLENILLFHFVTIAFSPPYIKILGRLWENGEGGGGREEDAEGGEEGKSEVGVPSLHLTHDSYYYFTPSATHTETSLSLLFFMLSCFPPQSLSLPVCLSVCVSLYLSPLFLSFSLTASLELL